MSNQKKRVALEKRIQDLGDQIEQTDNIGEKEELYMEQEGLSMELVALDNTIDYCS